VKPYNNNDHKRVINNIADYLSLNAECYPDKPAILYPVRITYTEMEERVNSYSSRLYKSGFKAGTRTLILVPAGIDFFVLTFALLRIGSVPVMIDPGMGINTMLSVLSGFEPEAFIGTTKAHILRFLCPSGFRKLKFILTTGPPFFGRSKRLKNLIDDHLYTYPRHLSKPDETAAILFTSGSTGPAKGVIYTSHMLKSQIEITKSQFNIGSEETDLCTFPLLGLFALCHGNSTVLASMDMKHPAKLNPKKIIKNINDFSCTQMFGSPMILNKLAEYGLNKNLKLPSLRNIISAGAPVHRQILESFSKLVSRDAVVHTPYGATEALPVTDITASELFRIYSDESGNENGICIGDPVTGLDLKIIDINDEPIESLDKAKELPVGEVGEIVVKGPWVSSGYYQNDNADLFSKLYDPATGETWHRLGDLGKKDKLGRLWFYGRKSQRVTTSEGTLFTIPCEAIFNRHPNVARCALVGVKMGESGFKKPVICVQLRPGIFRKNRISRELYELGRNFFITIGISDILFKKDFPVDPRHNAKIFREKLALWAFKRIT
jgi:acyl-CoA synthetase (AMP-forming)/AMP-acid ligase II